LIGVFQVRVAVNLDPARASGDRRRVEGRVPVDGPLLAGVVGLGLIAYGFYMGVLAVDARRT
jgi:hypothetical protein